MKKMIEVKFKQGFSFNGQWYKKDEIKEFDVAIAEKLCAKGVAIEVVKNKAAIKSKKER